MVGDQWGVLVARAQAAAKAAARRVGLGAAAVLAALQRLRNKPPQPEPSAGAAQAAPATAGKSLGRRVAVFAGWTGLGLLAALGAFIVSVTHDMPSTEDLWEASDAPSITFLDRNGRVIRREGAQAAPPVDIEALPPHVIQAFLAIEDRRFYQHFGVDLAGLVRASARNIQAGRVVQGGSTITQQLAKNLFLTNDRTLRRKAQEIILALWLETRFTKNQLLALYLSRVYFGAGAWGIEAAAERFFDRPAADLTLPQAALLAGLVKAPSRLNPASDEAAARARAALVLQEMHALDQITDEALASALDAPLNISAADPNDDLGYFRDWIDPLLNEVIGQARDDFIVQTTIDLEAQRAAQAAVEARLEADGETARIGQAALLSLDAEGGVVAMVGGRSYDSSQFNRATQARRQPGSAFKYFIYLAAMEEGYTPWTVRVDAPITIGDWSPANYTGRYAGPLSLTSAYARSVNTVAIQIANEIGGERVIAAARRLGVTSPLQNFRSLALGAQEVTLLELTQAYGAMAAEGRPLLAFGVREVRRADGVSIWRQPAPAQDRVIAPQAERYMNLLMSRVVEAGTATGARMPGRGVGGKTGTGNDYRDAWFIGYTPGMVTGVWVGNDDFSATRRVTGGAAPVRIWLDYMEVALRDAPPQPLSLPGPDEYAPGPALTASTDLAPIAQPAAPIVGAPLSGGAVARAAVEDTADRSLDFGPEG